IIIGVLAYGAWLGYRRGFLMVAIDLAGFVLAVVAASLVYAKLGAYLARRLNIFPSFAEVITFLVMLMIIQILYAMAARQILRSLPKDLVHSSLNRYAGVVINTGRTILIIAIGLVVFTGLPFTAGQKEVVAKAGIPKLLLSYSGKLQQGVGQLLGGAISDTLNFITIKPDSGESIALGFTTTSGRVDAATEEAMLVLVNQERTSRGLGSLVMNQTAREVARQHSRDMFARGYFAHTNPDGLDPFQRMEAGGVKFQAAGENLALAPTLQLAHNGLMNSPGHRANILSDDYGTVGIGIIDGGRYGLMVTQNFTN
ncbi:MAG TPA: CvpA family protein, partial [Candidatus Saccharimonadales bacterium]|nr:CvpA family protein [Candidatus Saccharimonadales bacterium]